MEGVNQGEKRAQLFQVQVIGKTKEDLGRTWGFDKVEGTGEA